MTCRVTTARQIAEIYLQKRSLIDTLYVLHADLTPLLPQELEKTPKDKINLYIRLAKERYR